MTIIAVTVPRGLILTANQRLHWAPRAERTAAIRTLAYAAWKTAGSPRHERVEVHCEVAYPDRRTRDVHNFMPTAKACLDGFVSGVKGRGGHLLPDDDDAHLHGPFLVPAPEPSGGAYFRFTFTIKDRP